MRILVTNDDGIDSVGLHVLARAMLPFGEVVVGAPAHEYSGASAAVGSIHSIHPEMHEAHIDGIDTAWAITAPPAMCVLLATHGALGEPFDLVVSGINPGANVGRAIYHSGTIGAAMTARTRGITGIAVSQAVPEGGVLGQAPREIVKSLRWETAAAVTVAAVESIANRPLDGAGCLNINVPSRDLGDILGWRRTAVSARVAETVATVDVKSKEGHENSFDLKLTWGPVLSGDYTLDEDVGAVAAGYVATTWLGKMDIAPQLGGDLPELAIAALLAG